MTLLPITQLPRTGLPKRALVVGDPARAAQIAGLLEDHEEAGANREYLSFTGRWNGTPLVVSSHGVGGPGAICLFQELADAGVETILRLGTAGAIAPQVRDGDLVIAESAIRDDGVTQQLVPAEYPAAATPEVVLALTKAAETQGAPYHRGLVWTRAAFHPGPLATPIKPYTEARALAIEMELSALLVLAAIRGLKAGGALVVDGRIADELIDDGSGYDPHRNVVAEGVARGSRVALDALAAL